MTHEEILNLLSEHQLSMSTLDFLEQVKFKKYDIETLDKFTLIAHVNNNPSLQKKIHNSYYEMGFCPSFPLLFTRNPSPSFLSLDRLNKKRKSTRTFTERILSFQEISSFMQLFYTLTGCETVDFKGTTITRHRRNIASGGALYPTEIHLVNHRNEELPLGVYRYNVIDFKLEQIQAFDTQEKKEGFYTAIMHSSTGAIDYDHATAFLVFSSILNKHSFKYKDFGVVLSLLELGEFVHAAYLAAAALDIGCCSFGGFLNNQMHQLLELKNGLHQPFLCMAIGTKKGEEDET